VALVLDLVQEGKTLLRVMSREFPDGLPLVQALQVLLGLIQGVEYAHDKGVVHGDIKPENVLIHGNFRDARTWVPKLTDFGTVGILAIPVTIDGQPAMVVSPRYASPEHVLGMDRLDARSDIYCLGLLLHYLLTGQHASNAATVQEAAATVVHPVPVAALVDQPDSIVKIFQKATRVNPEERFESCREFAMGIREALDGLGAELVVEDLQADLLTEVMEDRKEARKALWEKQQSKQGGDAAGEHVTGETAVAPEDTPAEEDDDLGRIEEEDEDTADQVSPFGNRLSSTDGDTSTAKTEVPGDDREYLPEDISTPAPVGTPMAEESGGDIPIGVWVAGVIAILVIVAVVAFSL